jgi:hypothetical protein
MFTIGQSVYVVAPYEEIAIEKIKIINESDFYTDTIIDLESGKRVLMSQCFDHKPVKIIKSDFFGNYSVWE